MKVKLILDKTDIQAWIIERGAGKEMAVQIERGSIGLVLTQKELFAIAAQFLTYEKESE